MLELYWAQLFRQTVGEDIAKDWQPLRDAQPDGNPILSIGNLENKRALRVIYNENEGNYPVYPEAKGKNTFYNIYPHMNIGSTLDDETELNELVLVSDVSNLAEEEARKLIRMHCYELMSENTLEEQIKTYEDRVGMVGYEDYL